MRRMPCSMIKNSFLAAGCCISMDAEWVKVLSWCCDPRLLSGMQDAFIQTESNCKHLRTIIDRKLKSNETTKSPKVPPHLKGLCARPSNTHTITLSFNHTFTSSASSFPFWALGAGGSKPWLCGELMKAETFTSQCLYYGGGGFPQAPSSYITASWLHSKDINVFIAATAAPGLFEMSLLRDDAGKELVERRGRGRALD